MGVSNVVNASVNSSLNPIVVHCPNLLLGDIPDEADRKRDLLDRMDRVRTNCSWLNAGFLFVCFFVFFGALFDVLCDILCDVLCDVLFGIVSGWCQEAEKR